jgi:hypothetical protein
MCPSLTLLDQAVYFYQKTSFFFECSIGMMIVMVLRVVNKLLLSFLN